MHSRRFGRGNTPARWPWLLIAGMCLLFCTGACVPCLAQVQVPVPVRTPPIPALALHPPVADFAADVTRGTAPLTVRFTDDSKNKPTAWLWDFNADGQAESRSQFPTYTYTGPGVYSVTLTVSGSAGRDTVTKYQYITVTKEPGAPVAGFSAEPRQGTAPLAVRFTDASRNNPSAWLWDFDADGVIDSWEKDPLFTYPEPGSYTVILIVASDTGKDEETRAGYITVGPGVMLPVADFTIDSPGGTAPLTVLFTDGSRNTPTAWEWDFGNDGVVDSREQNPEWTFPDPGIFSVRLIVRNSAGSDGLLRTRAVTVRAAVPAVNPGSSLQGQTTSQASVTTVATTTAPSVTVPATTSAASPVQPDAPALPPAPDPGPLPGDRLLLLVLVAAGLLAGGYLGMRSCASRKPPVDLPELRVELSGGIEYGPEISSRVPGPGASGLRERDGPGQGKEGG